MTENITLQDQITPYWTAKELNDILTPSGNVLDSDERIQRDKLKQAVESQTDDAIDLRIMFSSIVGWQNKDTAIKLWAGHIDKAEETRSQSYSSPEAVEAALIERFGQPVYQKNEYTKEELVDLLVPTIRASPISELRPEVWNDDENARKQVEKVVSKHVENKGWSR